MKGQIYKELPFWSYWRCDLRITALYILNMKCCIMGLLKTTSSMNFVTEGCSRVNRNTRCILWTDNDLSTERAVSWWILWTLTVSPSNELGKFAKEGNAIGRWCGCRHGRCNPAHNKRVHCTPTCGQLQPGSWDKTEDHIAGHLSDWECVSYKTVTNADTVFLLTKLWKLGWTHYEGVISCKFSPRIEKRWIGNCVEGSVCGLFWDTIEALT
jgi:hypothetical protein